MIKRPADSAALDSPCFAGVFCVKDGPSRAYDPPSIVADEIEVDKFFADWCNFSQPRCTFVIGKNQETVDHTVVTA